MRRFAKRPRHHQRKLLELICVRPIWIKEHHKPTLRLVERGLVEWTHPPDENGWMRMAITKLGRDAIAKQL